MLFAPGNQPRRSHKALTLGADAVALDLEDACPLSEKVAARGMVIEALMLPRVCLGYVRINSLETEFAFGDIQAVVRPGIDGLMLTKVESAEQLRQVNWLIGQIERERGMPVGQFDLIPLVETAKGFAQIFQIAAACPRVRRLAVGSGDLTYDLGLEQTIGEEEIFYYRNLAVHASRAAGIDAPIDVAWLRVNDSAGYAQAVDRTRRHGFQGRLCIHPNQIELANAAMRPSDEVVEQARRIDEAFRQAEEQGLAAIQVDGLLIDYPIAYRARRVLSLIDRIDTLETPREL
ncbi:CoA ester lyase [Pseudomonas sp. 13B_2.1_Bac1]|uniref:HpcH/HpaI aldolase/citrate lyase family protein n=1 Tax=Pseudomonas sp. 13B_2.1_Bac1 TaxID=2971624 RepID=UPI0021CA8E91|nr:CoA ester lyase [Pseudomonas sp. 13B_2.1_Bac1]MCU1785206.1 CoA ester lyase [Pseudomonas sp. 13B_2.1_Bac1]